MEHKGNNKEKVVDGVKFLYCDCGKRFADRNVRTVAWYLPQTKMEKHIRMARASLENAPASHILISIGG